MISNKIRSAYTIPTIKAIDPNPPINTIPPNARTNNIREINNSLLDQPLNKPTASGEGKTHKIISNIIEASPEELEESFAFFTLVGCISILSVSKV